MKTQTSAEKLEQHNVAMTVTLVSWAMMFASLFLGYFIFRFNAPVWPPVELVGVPKVLPFISTIVMALSSVTYWMMEKNLFKDENKTKLFWVATFALGLGFLGCQWQLWSDLKASGILVTNGIVPSMLYAFTWLHAAHIVLGLVGLLWLAWFVFKNTNELTDVKVINVGKFWHFLGVIWLLMYLMLFVL